MDVVPVDSKRKAVEYRNPWPRRLKRSLIVILNLVLLLACLAVGAFVFATKSAEADAALIEEKLMVVESEPTVILSADGVELFRVVEEYRKPFKLDDVPEHVRQAFLAAEDRRFYSHSGVDPIGLIRALGTAAKDRRLSQGGSTISMQLSKRLITGDERSFERKIKDIALASQLERVKTKDQILELYLKQVYFGEGAYGLASAADVYFRKPIGDLTVAEAAILARCVRRPSDENPIVNYDKALNNGHVVLNIMLEEGMISPEEHKAAKLEKPKVRAKSPVLVTSKTLAPYFVDYVFRTVRQEIPDVALKEGGYRVETTIRMDIQKFAEESVKKWVKFHRRDRVREGCFVLLNANGEIVAMVGGTDYQRDQFNTVTMGRRPPGSSFKPIVYAAAMQTGKLSEYGTVSNAPISLPDGRGKVWQPKNSGRWESGSYPLGTAFAYSINRPAIWTSFDTGLETVVQYAHDRFGIRSKLSPVRSLALGPIGVRPIEMAEAYSVFALGGNRVEPFGIRRVTGPNGAIVYQGSGRRHIDQLRPDVAASMDRLLQQVVTRGTATAARVVPGARGKTGTTNDNRDAWFCGYSDGLIGVAWVGSRENETMSSTVFGGTVAIKFWVEIMNYAREAYAGKIPKPTDRAPVQVNAAAVTEPKVEEDPVVSTEPPAPPVDPKITPAPELVEPDPAGTTEPEPIASEPVKPEVVPSEPPKENPKPTPPKQRPVPEETVEVELCAETYARATPFCMETITRTMRKSLAPKRSCPKHPESTK